MQHYIDTAKTYIDEHKRALVRVAVIVGIVLVIGLFVGLFVYNTQSRAPKIVYQPVSACDLFTVAESHELLGPDTIGNVTKPTVSGNTATSKCSYTDTNKDQTKMRIAAVALRMGINDEGVQENKDDFVASKTANTHIDIVTGIGDAAFFNRVNGQLSILNGKQWLLLNYGVGSDPAANTLDDAVKLAHIVLNDTVEQTK